MHWLPVKCVSAYQRWANCVLAVFGVAVMVASIAASTGRLDGGRPGVQAASGSRSIDLSHFEPDAEARHTFTLINTAASVIEILGVDTSWGCELAAVLVGDRIGPGTSALSNRGGGLCRGTLTMDTSSGDPDLKQIVYSLPATIPLQIWTEPETIEFPTGHVSLPSEPIRLVFFTAAAVLAASRCHVSTSRQLADTEPVAPVVVSPGGELESEPGRLSFLAYLKDNRLAGRSMDCLTLEFEGRPEPPLNAPVIAAVNTAASGLMVSPAPTTSSHAPAVS